MISRNCSTYGNTQKQQRKIVPPLEELEKGLSDWIKELRSILQNQNNLLTIYYGKKQSNQKSKQLYDTESCSGIKKEQVEKHTKDTAKELKNYYNIKLLKRKSS